MLTLHAPDHALLPSPDQKPRAAKDFSLTQTDYERFRAFLLEKTGLDFAEDKRQILARGLAEVLQTADCANLDELYVLLQGHSVTSQIWDQVVSVLTVGETYFFRNSSHFDCLAKHILPGIMADREHSSRRIRIWSAGCATGEEPYSVAILLRDVIPNFESWNITILATDLNREALGKAEEGVYGPWSFRGVEPRIQNTYFRLVDKQYVLDDRIRRMVNFDYLNLVGDPYPSLTNNTNAMDIILCRNVTIYFSPQTTIEVIQRFHHSLTAGGWLIPGPSEPNMVFYGDFEAKNYPGTVVYQKSVAIPAATRLAASRLPHTPAFTPPPAVMKPRTTGEVTRLGAIKHAPADAYQLAIDLLQDGKADEALIKLYEKLDRDPEFVPTYYTLGKIYANKGNLEEAQSWCERAVNKDRLHPEPYYTLALIYQQHGMIDMALAALKKAIFLDREFILAHYNLAQLYQHQHDPSSARRSLQNALRLLDGKPLDLAIPEGDGLVVGRLRELIENELALVK